MTTQGEFRRYLVNIDSISTNQLFTDCLVIGTGIAGLRAAIEAAQTRKVIVVCKDNIEKSNTWDAQGGIASVLKSQDSFQSHIEDTLNTGCGLCEPEVVELVVRKGPELVRQLLDWGVQFDLSGEDIAVTIEGGHSHSRVAHAHGDETGRVIAETMIKYAKSNPNIRIIERFYAIDLITDDHNQCLGVIGQGSKGRQIIWAGSTILATGGAGRLYRETTNSEIATGDGLPMAYRAGAMLRDMEFMQFHPTTLYIAGASRALITEAVRGEGAKLVDSEAEEFMKEYHEKAELAPRDVVSRAILSQMLKTGSTHVYLDVRHFDKQFLTKRFPRISEICESFDIDTSTELIPVRPSAHYMIGGVKTDSSAGTNIRNFYACGEVASTGLHGANRLGSNSLLEGLVFGKIAGQSAAQNAESAAATRTKIPPIEYNIPSSDRTRLDISDVKNSLRALMWRNVGITRREKPLAEAQEIIRFWQRYVMDKIFARPDGWQCQNMLTLAMLMATAAQQRKESRGVHFRQDYPEKSSQFQKHIEISRD